MEKQREQNAWLVRVSGPLAGTRHLVNKPVTRVGRDPGNDVVLEGDEASVVSSRHLEIRKEDRGYRLRDLGSTNGTYIDGNRVAESILEADSVISLGISGPQLVFKVGVLPVMLATTAILPAAATNSTKASAGSSKKAPGSGAPMGKKQEDLLSDAVRRARLARLSGKRDQTGIIMREMLGEAIERSGKKFKILIGVLILAIVAISWYAAYTIQDLKREKQDIDGQIQAIESKLRSGAEDSSEIDSLIEELNMYQEKAIALQRNLLYRIGARSSESDFIEEEIRTLMAEFGAEVYSIPPEFLERVNRYIVQYQKQDRRIMERALGRARNDLTTVRQILMSENLPPDLAYIALVESAFITENASEAGAVGLWQFTAATARAYGLVVNDEVDDRLDIKKSTRAAARYIRELILDFGAGSSVMLALAAYNLGPGKVKTAVRKVEDPIKQRNFWYLYRIRALPEETCEYVPKIFAAVIIGRQPEQFGF